MPLSHTFPLYIWFFFRISKTRVAGQACAWAILLFAMGRDLNQYHIAFLGYWKEQSNSRMETSEGKHMLLLNSAY